MLLASPPSGTCVYTALQRFRLSDPRLPERLRTRLRTLVEVALILLLAVQAARLLWLLWTPSGPLGATAATHAAPPEPPPALVLAADPFHPAAAPSATPAAEASGLRLHGVRLGPDGSSAIVSVRDTPQRAVRVGDAVVPGVTLRAVAHDHVVVDTAGGARRVALDAAPARPGTPAPRTPAAAASASRSAPGPAGGTVDPAALVAQAGLSARVENGTITGYTLIPRGDGHALRQAGLASGDVLLAVNGSPLTPERIAELEPELARGGQARLTVQRDGRTHTLTLRTNSP